MSLLLLSSRCCGAVTAPSYVTSPMLVGRKGCVPLPQVVQHMSMSYQKRKKKALAKQMQGRQMIAPESKAKAVQEEMIKGQHLQLDSLGQIADAWVPIPSEHRASIFSLQGIRQRWEHLRKIARTTFSIAVIRRKDKEFKPIPFAQQIQENLVKLQADMSSASRSGIKFDFKDTVTAQALSQLQKESRRRHFWEFVAEVERPRVVAAFTFPVETKENLFAQVTVQLNLRQKYGLEGQPLLEKDVTEFVVAEKSLVDPKAKWRICAKIIPPFLLPPTQQQE
eukprot:m.8156 g.8156  ORF g.8156 m.8156 type:complete len:280 (+) comp3033_c0_seq1:91-930(+)